MKIINRLKEKGIIHQVAIIFLIGIIVTGVLTYLTQYGISSADVRRQVERVARGASHEVMDSVREYPAHEWLLKYWYENYEDLDIEYDADYSKGTETEEKYRLFQERHPEVCFEYASTEEVEALPPEDQKLYAEIAYSWFITRIDQIKVNNNIDFLFGVVTEEPYDSQFFLFSAADPGAVRGTNYEEVYTLGVQVEVGESQQMAMVNTKRNSNHLAEAGDYMDYYEFFDEVNGHDILVGLTFNLSDMLEEIGYGTLSGVTTAMVGQFILSAICLVLIYFFVLKPLKEIQGSIRTYTETKDSADIIDRLKEVKSDNEMGQLSEDVSQLAREMDDYHSKIETITKEKERISTELELASRIQASMLPSTFPPYPNRSEFDIFASMTPAKGVGGDFYDFFLIDEDHLGMVMADVSGKGVPAALFMMASKIMLKNGSGGGKTPSEIITSVNNAICANNKEEMFVTVWLGILELSTGKLTYSNAGHEYPAIKNGDGKFELIKERHGFIVGGMEGMKYREGSMLIKPGTRIFLYTDGVPEATAEDGSMFGLDHMMDVLNSDPDASCEKIITDIKDAVSGFVKEAEQFDDVTVMCIAYNGPKKE